VGFLGGSLRQNYNTVPTINTIESAGQLRQVSREMWLRKSALREESALAVFDGEGTYLSLGFA